jgi:hypothetical protein
LALVGACLALLAAAAGAADRPDILAPAAIVIQADADEVVSNTDPVLYARDADERRAIASTTKLMTARSAICSRRCCCPAAATPRTRWRAAALAWGHRPRCSREAIAMLA